MFHSDISFMCWLRVIHVLFYTFCGPHSRKTWWSRRQGIRRYHNSWCTYTLKGLLEHVPEICVFHWWSICLAESRIPGLGTTLRKCWIIRSAWLSDDRLKVFYCMFPRCEAYLGIVGDFPHLPHHGTSRYINLFPRNMSDKASKLTSWVGSALSAIFCM